ncbi:energy-coupling factor transporter transmembrane protein EcfT [Arthrobacter pigmenti]|uniref:Energy-coupling factor transporter transmembrane protein EcfT n=1 Tax=Arthrobacter pigmenti TaxID=271432 RepID=A0A846S0K1_9MICC|nr:hypothetical protein [Arthrobacter pigmenti]NJC23961.1 energy-coupling factor transporter transmembrane protein EcfT [Arthrobacter pigmenti]
MELIEHSGGWNRAVRLAGGLQDHGISAAVKRYYLTVFPLVVIVSVIVVWIVGVVISGRADWLFFGIGVMLSGLAVMISGFVYSSKKVSPLVTPDEPSIHYLVSKGESKRGRRQIHGSVPADGDERIVARGLAIQMRQGHALQLLIAPGFILAFLPQVFRASDALGLLYGLVIALYAAAFVLLAREFHRTTIFLKSTEPDEPA